MSPKRSTEKSRQRESEMRVGTPERRQKIEPSRSVSPSCSRAIRSAKTCGSGEGLQLLLLKIPGRQSHRRKHPRLRGNRQSHEIRPLTLQSSQRLLSAAGLKEIPAPSGPRLVPVVCPRALAHRPTESLGPAAVQSEGISMTKVSWVAFGTQQTLQLPSHREPVAENMKLGTARRSRLSQACLISCCWPGCSPDIPADSDEGPASVRAPSPSHRCSCPRPGSLWSDCPADA